VLVCVASLTKVAISEVSAETDKVRERSGVVKGIAGKGRRVAEVRKRPHEGQEWVTAQDWPSYCDCRAGVCNH
jgi:hypothetical protein